MVLSLRGGRHGGMGAPLFQRGGCVRYSFEIPGSKRGIGGVAVFSVLVLRGGSVGVAGIAVL